MRQSPRTLLLAGIACLGVQAPLYAQDGGAARIAELFEQVVRDDDEAMEELLRMPGADVRGVLAGLVHIDGVDGRRAALRLLGEVGGPADIGLLERLARRSTTQEIVERSVQSSFGDALERLLEREPRAVYDVVSRYPHAHPSLLHPIIRVIGKEPSHETLDLLGRLLGKVPQADPLLLWEIGRIGESLWPPFDALLCAEVRGYADDEDILTVVQALQVVTQLRDLTAVPRLIELLRRNEDVVARTAHESLRALTGQDLGREVEAWTHWYERESSWWNRRGADLLRQLPTADSASAASLLQELVQKRLFRAEMADVLVETLAHRDLEVVCLAAAALASLGVEEAVAPLVERMAPGPWKVEHACWQALCRVTGKSLPQDPELWRRYLKLCEEKSRERSS